MRRTTVGTAPGHYASSRDGRARWSAARLSIAWLALVLFALRALMPAGFMPDADALREGHFRIVYCAGAGPVPTGMDKGGHGMSAPPHAADDGYGPDAIAGSHDHHGMAGGRVDQAWPYGHAQASADGDDRQGPRAPGHSATVDCPFGLSSAYPWVAPVLAVWAPMLALAWHVPATAPSAAPSSGVVAGPPVGSRAPPNSLD